MYRADGIAESTLSVSANFYRSFYWTLHIADVIHGIENSEHIDPIDMSTLDKFFH